MKLQSLELKNYKSHKHFIAKFDGQNKLIQGNKGSGKTSLRDAFYWLMTGSMVDDPTPVDKDGVIINHNTISVEATFTDGLVLKVESSQNWVKDVLKSRHKSTYFYDGVPMIERDYQARMSERYGTIEQRKIMLDPEFFAYGDGLRTTGAVSKTATQNRRDYVVTIAGADELGDKLKENEATIKKTKFALSTNKKEMDDVYAGIESLNGAKMDLSGINKEDIETSIANLNKEKSSSEKSLNVLESGNDTINSLKRTLSDAQTELSQAQAKYSLKYTELLEESLKPHNEYTRLKNDLLNKLNEQTNAQRVYREKQYQLVKQHDALVLERQELYNEHAQVKAEVYRPNSTSCITCSQPLPVGELQASVARYNINKSNKLENIVNRGTTLNRRIDELSKQINLTPVDYGIDSLNEQLTSLVEPTINFVPGFEETSEYTVLNQKVVDAMASIEANSDDGIKVIYQNAIDNFNRQINELTLELGKFNTNDHIVNQIDLKGDELVRLATVKDELNETLDKCNAFTRKALDDLDSIIKEKFDGISFKMFEQTLDGDQKDTCITYGLTPNGFIPWESLSGGQKRSATIKLANAFMKAWGVEIPLFIDDTQIYTDDELSADMQLIRITEVPYAQLEVK